MGRILCVASILALVCALAACQGGAPASSPIERGKYLATAMGCNDCHTPIKAGPQGPELDLEHRFAGHLETLGTPSPPALPAGPWQVSAMATFTAWSGPWGVSYAANISPDEETGIGGWDEQLFITTIRQGKYMGAGRPLLPPMPWNWAAQLTDDDLKAVFAYLKSAAPMKNRVPPPVLAPPATPNQVRTTG